MTDLLEEAFAEAKKLSTEEQDALANWLLNEVISEKQWGDTFAASTGALETLAAEARHEHSQGETQPTRPDSGKRNRG